MKIKPVLFGILLFCAGELFAYFACKFTGCYTRNGMFIFSVFNAILNIIGIAETI